MSYKPNVPEDETLNPEDWESMRLLGHRMIDDMLPQPTTATEERISIF